ncbi:hypothetical protein ACTXT7_010687 [Hymenolepis weldensis]
MASRLVTSANRYTLDELAESGNKIQELVDRPRIRAVGTPTPSFPTTQQPDVLTKQKSAFFNPPAWPYKQRELPKRADDSNSVQKDMHEFLQEYDNSSGKRRKTPKLTAANQQKPFHSATKHRSSKRKLLL